MDEQFIEYLEASKKRLSIADHMLTQTFPLVKDPKLLLGVLNNLFLTVEFGLTAVLFHQRKFGNIPSFGESFESRLATFNQYLVEKYDFFDDVGGFLERVSTLVDAHKQSPVEFSRQNSFVICDDNYNIEKIEYAEMRELLSKAKKFFSSVYSIIKVVDV